MWSLALAPATGSCLRDAGITGVIYYTLSRTLKAGISLLGMSAAKTPERAGRPPSILIHYKDEMLRRHADANGKVMLSIQVY